MDINDIKTTTMVDLESSFNQKDHVELDSDSQIFKTNTLWLLSTGYRIFLTIWKMKTYTYVYPWEKLGTFFAVKRQFLHLWGGNQAKKPASLLFFIKLDFVQIYFGSIFCWGRRIWSIQNFPPPVINGWRVAARVFREIRNAIRVVFRGGFFGLFAIRLPKLIRQKKLKVALPSYWRNVGGFSNVKATLLVFFIPFAIIKTTNNLNLNVKLKPASYSANQTILEYHSLRRQNYYVCNLWSSTNNEDDYNILLDKYTQVNNTNIEEEEVEDEKNLILKILENLLQRHTKPDELNPLDLIQIIRQIPFLLQDSIQSCLSKYISVPLREKIKPYLSLLLELKLDQVHQIQVLLKILTNILLITQQSTKTVITRTKETIISLKNGLKEIQNVYQNLQTNIIDQYFPPGSLAYFFIKIINSYFSWIGEKLDNLGSKCDRLLFHEESFDDSNLVFQYFLCNESSLKITKKTENSQNSEELNLNVLNDIISSNVRDKVLKAESLKLTTFDSKSNELIDSIEDEFLIEDTESKPTVFETEVFSLPDLTDITDDTTNYDYSIRIASLFYSDELKDTKELVEYEDEYEDDDETGDGPVDGGVLGPVDGGVLGPVDGGVIGPVDGGVIGPVDGGVIGPRDGIVGDGLKPKKSRINDELELLLVSIQDDDLDVLDELTDEEAIIQNIGLSDRRISQANSQIPNHPDFLNVVYRFLQLLYTKVLLPYANLFLTSINTIFLRYLKIYWNYCFDCVTSICERYFPFLNLEITNKKQIVSTLNRVIQLNSKQWRKIRLSWSRFVKKNYHMQIAELIHLNQWRSELNYFYTQNPLGFLIFNLSVITGLSYIGFGYYSLWNYINELQDRAYPSRYRLVKEKINTVLYNKYTGKITKPVFVPDGGPLFTLYKNLYTFWMDKRIVAKYLADDKTSGDLLPSRRSMFHKSLLTPQALLKSSFNLKQKVGQSDYNHRFLKDNVLSAFYERIVNHNSITYYALGFLKEMQQKVSYNTLYSALGSSTFTNSRWVKKIHKVNPNDNRPLKVYNYHWDSFAYKFEYFPYRSYLLIGKEDAGKTHLAKSIAATTNLPLIYFGSPTIFKRGTLIRELKFYKNTGLRPFLDGRHRLEIIQKRSSTEYYYRMQILFRLAERIKPCVLWLPQISLYNGDPRRNSRARRVWLLLMIDIINILERNNKEFCRNRNMIILGGCTNTRYLDPIYLGKERFNELIRLDNPNVFHRKSNMLGLIQTHGLKLSKDFDFSMIQNATMGYNMKDIVYLVESIRRMCLSLKLNTVSHFLILEAIERQQNISSYRNYPLYTNSWQFAAYKLGKALVQKVFFPQPLFQIKGRFPALHFYYLSKYVLEVRQTDSCVTSSLMLYYFYMNLAGIAGRDAWISICNQKFDVFNEIENNNFNDDISLAVEIFRAYWSEIGYLSVRNQKNKQLNQTVSFAPDLFFLKGSAMAILGEIPEIDKVDYYDNDIQSDLDFEILNFHNDFEQANGTIFDYSPVSDQIPLSRYFLQDIDYHLSDRASLYSTIRYGSLSIVRASFHDFLTDEEYWDPQPLNYYHIRSFDLKKSERQNFRVEESRKFFNKRSDLMKWNGSFDNLKLQSEVESSANQLFRISNRTVWNPKPIVPVHLEFLERKNVADRLVMSYLYSVYIEKPIDPNELVIVGRKRPFWFRDEIQERIQIRIEAAVESARTGKNIDDIVEEKLEELEKKIELFSVQQRMVETNTELLRPELRNMESRYMAQDEIRFFDYMIEMIPLEGLCRFDNLVNEKDYSKNKAVPLEVLLHQNVLDSYNTLYRWFMGNQTNFLMLLRILLLQGVIWPEQLQAFNVQNVDIEMLKKMTSFKPVYKNFVHETRPMGIRHWFINAINEFYANMDLISIKKNP